MVRCPFADCEWRGVVKITPAEMNRESKAGRPTLTWMERERILTLRVGNKTYREISRITGISIPTVEKYILKKNDLPNAKKELQETLLLHLKEHNNSRE